MVGSVILDLCLKTTVLCSNSFHRALQHPCSSLTVMAIVMGISNYTLFPSSEILWQSQLLKEANLKGSHNLKMYLQQCTVAKVTNYPKQQHKTNSTLLSYSTVSLSLNMIFTGRKLKGQQDRVSFGRLQWRIHLLDFLLLEAVLFLGFWPLFLPSKPAKAG